MSIDVKSFRRALGCFATGITVVTGADGDGAFGITINSFASVSLEPPLVLFSLGRASRLHDRVMNAPTLAINVLADDQERLSRHFAASAEQRLWDDVALIGDDSGPPLLAGCLAHFVCAREAVHQGGDNAVVIARVLRFEWRAEGLPLLYFRGSYGRVGGAEPSR